MKHLTLFGTFCFSLLDPLAFPSSHFFGGHSSRTSLLFFRIFHNGGLHGFHFVQYYSLFAVLLFLSLHFMFEKVWTRRHRCSSKQNRPLSARWELCSWQYSAFPTNSHNHALHDWSTTAHLIVHSPSVSAAKFASQSSFSQCRCFLSYHARDRRARLSHRSFWTRVILVGHTTV